jgi:hypothetical protein
MGIQRLEAEQHLHKATLSVTNARLLPCPPATVSSKRATSLPVPFPEEISHRQPEPRENIFPKQKAAGPDELTVRE